MHPGLLAALGFIFFTACSPITAPGSGDSDAAPLADAATIVDAGPDATPPVIECEENIDCGEHALCREVGQDRLCACAPGYAGDSCEFAGLVQDPGFSDATDVWSPTRGASVEPGTATPSGDQGFALFDTQTACNLPSVFQTIQMPPFDVADPFVLEIHYEVEGGFDFFDTPPPPAVGLNETWFHVPERFGTGSFSERICLGDAAYGGEVRLEIAPSNKPIGCPSPADGSLRVASVDIFPAGPDECPNPGEIPNGDMQNDDFWTLASGNNTSVEYVDGLGLDGSRALELIAVNRCSGASANGILSLPGPDRVPNLALQFDYEAQSNTLPSLALGDRQFRNLVSTAAPETERVCIPPELQGSAQKLTINLSGGSGLCSEVVNNRLMVDNIKFVSEPSCASTPGQVEGGFEYAPLAPAFGLSQVAQDGGQATVRTLSNPDLARSGSGVLELATEIRCSSAGINRRIYVPPPNGGGPALRIFSNISANPVSTTSVRVGDASLVLDEDGVWTQRDICVPPEFAGRSTDFNLQINGGSGSCSSFGTRESAFIDDLEIIFDPACPTL